ncbi:MAG: J domain-containing protein [Desulfatiglandaceae bacterium]
MRRSVRAMDIRKSYRTLELDYGASLDEVKQGYKDMVRVWHPDRFHEHPRLRKKAEEKLKEINRAYGELMIWFSRETAMTPLTDMGPFLPWWRKGLRGVALGAALLGRLLYQKIGRILSGMDPGRIFQVLLNYGKALDGVKTRKGGAEISPGATRGRESRKDMKNEPDFRSVFDEVAQERRARSNRER